MERRTFLSAGSASVLALAAAPRVTAVDARSNSPTGIVRAYYRRASAADTAQAFADQIPDLAHSASPLRDVAADIPNVFDGTVGQHLVDVTVVDENVSSEEIRETSDFFTGSVSDETIESIAEENAVVAATVESDGIIGGVFATEWLVAPEDGAWRLVWVDERNSPRAAARTFFRQVKTAETLAALDDPVAEWSHSLSPLVNVAEYTPWYFRGLRRQTLEGTTIAAENIDTGEIASEFAPVTNWASREEVDAIAEENAVVSVSLRDDQLGAEELEQPWLLAPENEQWRLVWF
jgi:hypothetical protein